MSSQQPPSQELLIVLLDHMNDSNGYSKKLSSWCDHLDLEGIQFARTANRRKQAGRTESIVIVLHGNKASLDDWLTQLISEHVDVNARGQKCKERKSVVLYRDVVPSTFNLQSESGQRYTRCLYDKVESGNLNSNCLEDHFSLNGLDSLWSIVLKSGLRVREFQR